MKSHPIKRLIDAACSSKGTTHSEIARKAGVSRETLYRILRGNGKRASVNTVRMSCTRGLDRAEWHEQTRSSPRLQLASVNG